MRWGGGGGEFERHPARTKIEAKRAAHLKTGEITVTEGQLPEIVEGMPVPAIMHRYNAIAASAHPSERISVPGGCAERARAYI